MSKASKKASRRRRTKRKQRANSAAATKATRVKKRLKSASEAISTFFRAMETMSLSEVVHPDVKRGSQLFTLESGILDLLTGLSEAGVEHSALMQGFTQYEAEVLRRRAEAEAEPDEVEVEDPPEEDPPVEAEEPEPEPEPEEPEARDAFVLFFIQWCRRLLYCGYITSEDLL